MTRSDARGALRWSVWLCVAAMAACLCCGLAGFLLGTPKRAPVRPRIHRLAVKSQPAGASLLINGRLIGATPAILENMPEGIYGLRLEREGFKPLNRQAEIGAGDLEINASLETLPKGLLSVEIEPAGAEVLLDGEFVGLTPLKDALVPAGNYELLIRKTNFEPHAAFVAIKPDAPQVFADFDLKDRVRGMLETQVRSEPQRLTHYLDLAHYLFINGNIDAAVDVYARGWEIMGQPLDFNGQGFNGMENMTKEETELEKRLRLDDADRFRKEIDKHYNHWSDPVAVRAFRKKWDQAKVLVEKHNIGSWPWVEQAARLHLGGGNYERAAQIYHGFIAAAPGSPDLYKAWAALVEINMLQHDVPGASAAFNQFYAACKNDGDHLEYGGQLIVQHRDILNAVEARLLALGLAEKALRRAAELFAAPADQARCQSELALVLVDLERAAEAVPVLRQALQNTAGGTLKEQRSLQLAEALRLAGELGRAREQYEKLEKSKNPEVRDQAQTGLICVKADELEKEVNHQK
jgi:tetratricopeptide (TPR) repeat protein